eukprot:13165084-Alexandrium_andersonii.AAC.1
MGKLHSPHICKTASEEKDPRDGVGVPGVPGLAPELSSPGDLLATLALGCLVGVAGGLGAESSTTMSATPSASSMPTPGPLVPPTPQPPACQAVLAGLQTDACKLETHIPHA